MYTVSLKINVGERVTRMSSIKQKDTFCAHIFVKFSLYIINVIVNKSCCTRKKHAINIILMNGTTFSLKHFWNVLYFGNVSMYFG
jgi:hypothetical protein